MTMRELARLANVSVATVSKAFSDAEDISYETKQEIFTIAKKFGCFGKFYKGKYKKKIIAVISHEFKSSFYSEIVEALQKIIEQNDCIPLISTDHFNPEIQSELIEYYISYLKVDGIFIFNMKEPLKKGYDIPIVSIFSSKDNLVDSISVITTNAFKESIEKLIALGHKKFAFIGEPLTRGKADLFTKLINRNKNTQGTVIETPYRFEKAGEYGIKKILSENIDCTAIICAYDNIAIGAIKELKKQKKSVPDDYSVIGSDNIEASEYIEVPLSTIGIDTSDVCGRAWELMDKKLKNHYYHSDKPVIVNGRLFLKDSIGKPKDLI